MKSFPSASKAPKKDGEGYEGKHTHIPYVDSALSNGRKELINWLKGRNYSISYF